MKSVKYIVFLSLMCIVGLCVYIAVQPSEFEVKRSKLINVHPTVVYSNIVDFKNWESWSPWKEKDTATVVTLGDETMGVGAVYAWTDSKGAGTIKTEKLKLNQEIDYTMQFNGYEPSKVKWRFEQLNEDKTKVTWTIKSKKTAFMFKALAFFSGGYDAMIGPDFERGLEKLDSVLINNSKKHNITITGIEQQLGGFYISQVGYASPQKLKLTFDTQYVEIKNFIVKNKLQQLGQPFAMYDREKNSADSIKIQTAISVVKIDKNLTNNFFKTGYMRPKATLKTIVKGDYIYINSAWDKAYKYCANNNLVIDQQSTPYEVYITGITETHDVSKWITEIHIPLKK